MSSALFSPESEYGTLQGGESTSSSSWQLGDVRKCLCYLSGSFWSRFQEKLESEHTVDTDENENSGWVSFSDREDLQDKESTEIDEKTPGTSKQGRGDTRSHRDQSLQIGNSYPSLGQNVAETYSFLPILELIFISNQLPSLCCSHYSLPGDCLFSTTMERQREMDSEWSCRWRC